MEEWTEQEEQQIIERAKTGDPEANYALSLWALRRGEEEPDEPRWNRLAAKCLVKAAQAGYGPAKEQMAALLGQANQSGQGEQTPPSAPAKRTAPSAPTTQRTTPSPSRPSPKKTSEVEADGKDGEAVPSRRGTAARRSVSMARPAETVRRLMSRLQKPREDEDRDQDQGQDQGFDVNEASWDDGYDNDGEERDDRPSRSGRRSGRRWGDDKWRLLEGVCVLVCVALLIAIAVMLITRRHDSGEDNSNSSIPPAGEVGSVDNSGGDSGGAVPASSYPDAATQAAIKAADLDIFPSPEDYVTEATSGTVSVSSEYLRLRKGPNTTYDPIAQMPNGTTVSVFAKKNDWDLILYQGGEGPVYGWCSSEYLIITAGTAADPGAGAAPTDAPGAAEG